jgi:uncharacterized protein YuzE
MRVRYDSEADILYIFVKEGSIKDTIEVSDDLFVEYDENNHIAGIELWQARKNLLPELMSYVEQVNEATMDLKS